MFCYKDQWDPGCTTTRHNIFNLALMLIKYSVAYNVTSNECIAGNG